MHVSMFVCPVAAENVSYCAIKKYNTFQMYTKFDIV